MPVTMPGAEECNKMVKVGDKITVYARKGGSNYQGTISQMDGEDVYVEVKRYNAPRQLHRLTGWYRLRTSSRGIPYVTEEK